MSYAGGFGQAYGTKKAKQAAADHLREALLAIEALPDAEIQKLMPAVFMLRTIEKYLTNPPKK
jgi:hypothetical protein